MSDIKVFGNVFDEDAKGMNGSMKVDGAEFTIAVDGTATKGKNADYYKFTAKPKDGGNGGKDIAGALFRSKNFFGQAGKPGIELRFKANVRGTEMEMNVTGFGKDKKKDGTPAKRLFYSLAPSRPREGAPAQATAAGVGSDEMPAPF